MGIIFATSHATENRISYPCPYYHVRLLDGSRLHGKTCSAITFYGQSLHITS